jgi:putative SOS response-associated peptidase YedK
MCGRFALYSEPKEIKAQFHLSHAFELSPNYNITPGRTIPVIKLNAEGQRCLVNEYWGLIPSWLSDDKAKGVINARYESVHQKPYFRAAFKKRRCLIIANGWYEWQKQGDKKQPYYFKNKDDKLLAFAGLWEHWGTGDDYLESCAIITRKAPNSIAKIHHRMPMILTSENYDTWLSDKTFSSISEDSANQFASQHIDYYPVSLLVNNPANNAPICIKPEKT